MKKLEVLAIAFLIGAGVMGVLVSILDLVGKDLSGGPWAWFKGTSAVTLLIVALLAIAIGLERWVRLRTLDGEIQGIADSLERLQELALEGPARVIDAIGGTEVTVFRNLVDLLKRVTREMRAAKQTIDDMSIGTSSAPNVQLTQAYKDAFNAYREAIVQVCSKKSIQYRELISFPPSAHFGRVEEVVNSEPLSFRIGYFLGERATHPPFNVMIIDSKTVIIYFPPSQVSGVMIVHSQIARLFQDYYNVVWRSSTRDFPADKDGRLKRLNDLRAEVEEAGSTAAEIADK